MTLGSSDAKKIDLFFGFKVKSQLCAWTTFAAVCVEGFCKKGTAAECAVRDCKKGAAAECIIRLEGWICC